MNINQLIESRSDIKQQMEDLNSQLNLLKTEKEELDFQLICKLDEQGLSRTANDKASVSINQVTVPDVTDWDVLHAHIIKTADFGLLQRRVSSTAYKEVLKLGEQVPGVQPRELRRINFKSL